MQGCPYVIYLAVFAESAGRASCDTLSAVDAGNLSQGLIEGRGNGCSEAALGRADGANLLDIPADGYTAFAENTFIGIAAQPRERADPKAFRSLRPHIYIR